MAIVLGHLARNAAEHGAARLMLTARRHETGVEVQVTDDGTGISAGNAGRVFEPFFTTGRSHGGTGMGLSIVRNILAAHHGEIALAAAVSGNGPTTFVLRFARA
jgi:two-component system, OmpR family, sensor kinase